MTLRFPVFKISKKSLNIVLVFFKCFFQKILLTIPDAENFTSEIENGRVVENIFPEKISHDLWKYNHFYKIDKKRFKEKFFKKKKY